MIRHLIATLLAAFALQSWAATEANQAPAAELQTVKGIGPSLSARIVQARTAAPFKDWNDLVERVAGVGPGNAAKLSQGGLTVAGAAYDAAAAKPRTLSKAASKKAATTPRSGS
ncbi:MAG: helix-hairpin-helix domain-containing protein [Burkholderiales bacterium]|nr:helix-hairpin-helix domain-containing protein [Burkholderiales bacterium]MDE1927761.1 helix-hairpin-helix domain-containing protein [Burkholderiales bacterium]MDE2160738.1 helix-hairpin-helix domain-containing protein [Burkholderiales bacterium]MDE2504230.1 helix-hairpin-helix domain-containing protein [Burkholderiales bacterium]